MHGSQTALQAGATSSKLDETEMWKALIRKLEGQANYVIRRSLVRDDKHVHGNSSTARARFFDREFRCPTVSYSCINKRFTNTKDRRVHQASNTRPRDF